MTDGNRSPTATPNRVDRAANKKRRAPLALFIVPVVLVVVAVIIFLLLRNGDVPIIGGEDDTVPPFDFTVKRALAVATVADADRSALAASAETVGQEITPTMDDLFTNAYLDPSNWRDGDYAEVFDAFAPDAAPAAEQNVDTLTLGADAGDVFQKVDPEKGTVTYEILFDPESHPSTAVVTVTFRATGERKDGTYLAIVSTGQYFLKDLDGWKITAFDVTRKDHETQPPSPSPSTSGSPSA